MQLVNFIGPNGFGLRADLRPRPPATDTVPENEQRRLALRRDLTGRPPACVIVLGDDGVPTPESLARARRAGCIPPESMGPLKLPAGALAAAPVSAAVTARAAAAAAAPTEVPYTHFAQFATGAGNVEGSNTITFMSPVRVESITLVVNQPGGTDNFMRLLWATDPDTVFEDQIFDEVDNVSAGAFQGIILQNAAPFLVIPVRRTFWDFPVVFLAQNDNAAGGATSLVDVLFNLTRLSGYVPPSVSLQLEATFASLKNALNQPRPPSVVYIQQQAPIVRVGAPSGPPIQYTAPTAATFSNLDILAQKLREAPGGIPHTQMLLYASQLGFSDPELAVTRAIQLATRPPLAATLTHGL